MTTEIDPFLTNTSFLNEDKVKILQQNRAPSEKNMKKDSVIAYVHMTRDTPLPLYAFWMTPTVSSLHSSICVST